MRAKKAAAMWITAIFFVSIVALLGLSFSYAQFGETLYIGNPVAGPTNTVSTGDIDPSIYCWLGKGGTYTTITPMLGFYDPPVQSITFWVDNAYPGYGSSTATNSPHRMACVVFLKNYGSVPVKVKSIDWDVPDYVDVHYWGGDIPEDIMEDLIDAINEADIPEDVKQELISVIEGKGHGMHEGLILDAGEFDALTFRWQFGDDTPEGSSFVGTCTVNFTEFTAP